ncbi:hypothetical protein GCM10008995_29100 [Halobellus salinus]|uniref:Uncharacterized protein n=1 Tax=Halobellus salinus TaxID=931585 RepID=A0A830EET8_9EURY|nr:hypothetical protein [Halobellus salinus]GGJ17524.1 hypothetical protein GCM10008995_29100 [Halobellus salinus]SMP35524.1 hypothetical protein SAMN06265347_13112 [Halobellus salinus]
MKTGFGGASPEQIILVVLVILASIWLITDSAVVLIICWGVAIVAGGWYGIQKGREYVNGIEE